MIKYFIFGLIGALIGWIDCFYLTLISSYLVGVLSGIATMTKKEPTA